MIKIINPGKFEKFFTEDAFSKERSRILKDFYDELEKKGFSLDFEKRFIKENNLNINIQINESEMSLEQKKIFDLIFNFCVKYSFLFQELFYKFCEYELNKKHMSQKLFNYLIEKNFCFPVFSICNSDISIKNINESGFLNRISFFDLEKKDFLLNFNFSKPFNYFWNKNWDHNSSVNVCGSVIAWGDFYYEAVKEIWKFLENLPKDEKIYFYRLNDFGQHTNNYYYLWLISKENFSKK